MSEAENKKEIARKLKKEQLSSQKDKSKMIRQEKLNGVMTSIELIYL